MYKQHNFKEPVGFGIPLFALLVRFSNPVYFGHRTIYSPDFDEGTIRALETDELMERVADHQIPIPLSVIGGQRCFLIGCNEGRQLADKGGLKIGQKTAQFLK